MDKLDAFETPWGQQYQKTGLWPDFAVEKVLRENKLLCNKKLFAVKKTCETECPPGYVLKVSQGVEKKIEIERTVTKMNQRNKILALICTKRIFHFLIAVVVIFNLFAIFSSPEDLSKSW